MGTLSGVPSGDMAFDADESAASRDAKQEAQDAMRHFGKQWAEDDEEAAAKQEANRLKRNANMKERYDLAKVAKVGETIACPRCKVAFVKKTYNHVFCSNGRTKKGMNSCKDAYWNRVDDKRAARAGLYDQN